MIILSSPGEIAFNLGKFPVYYYGICIGIATTLGLFVSYRITKSDYNEVNPDALFDIASIILISGVICARLYYCALNFGYYSSHITEILNTRQGGLSIHGGIIGGFIFGTLYCKIKHYPVLKMADIISFGLIIAQAVGRWGNFFNSEAYGLPAKHFWGVFIPESARVYGYEFYKYFHPTFLYESILNIFIFLILYFFVRNMRYKFDGLIFAIYLILYSVVRFFIEGLRLDSIVNVGRLHIAQIMSLIIIICAITFILYQSNKRRPQQNNQ